VSSGIRKAAMQRTRIRPKKGVTPRFARAGFDEGTFMRRILPLAITFAALSLSTIGISKFECANEILPIPCDLAGYMAQGTLRQVFDSSPGLPKQVVVVSDGNEFVAMREE
jgi:hypothetical protein